jgi:hypothetical protein
MNQQRTKYYAFPGGVEAVPYDPVCRVEQFFTTRLTLVQSNLRQCPILQPDGTLKFDEIDDAFDEENA